jgi:hypothetical protein
MQELGKALAPQLATVMLLYQNAYWLPLNFNNLPN